MPVEGDGTRTRYVRFLSMIFVVQIALGIALLVCGGLAVRYTKGQTDTFGPPYFLGAFIVGCLIVVAGIISFLMYRKTSNIDTENQSEIKDLACFLCAQLGFCVATCMGSFIGFFFCAIFGLKDCDPNEFGSFCNYTENMSENKALAVFILLFIIASAAVSILIACCNCRHAGSFGVQMQRGGRPLVIVGGSQGVTYHGTSSTPMMTGSTYQYPPVVVGGNMQTPGVQYPVNTSSAQYPVNTSGAQYPINTSGAQYPVNPQFAQGQAGGTNTSVQELQEQNRLLQEQIRLQQQQLQLQQQLQQQVGPGGMATPIDMAAPPSYDECVTDEAAMIRLQEHNLALQKQSQQQQLALEKKSPLSGSGLEPSAPPT